MRLNTILGKIHLATLGFCWLSSHTHTTFHHFLQVQEVSNYGDMESWPKFLYLSTNQTFITESVKGMLRVTWSLANRKHFQLIRTMIRQNQEK